MYRLYQLPDPERSRPSSEATFWGSAGEREPSAGNDPGKLAVALIDALEGAIVRPKVEHGRAPFDGCDRFVLLSLLT